jgi:hypothetical protein
LHHWLESHDGFSTKWQQKSQHCTLEKSPAAALYYSYWRQMVLQNYEFEKEEEDGETEKIKTLFQSSSLQARL